MNEEDKTNDLAIIRAKRRASESKYAKSHLRVIIFRLHQVYDADIIAFLDGMENRQGELKQILREEMARRSVGVTD